LIKAIVRVHSDQLTNIEYAAPSDRPPLAPGPSQSSWAANTPIS